MNERVEFIGPAQPAQDGGLTCFAMVDGERVKCHFTWDALVDCGQLTQPATAEDLFDAGRSRLLEIATRKIGAGEIDDGMVWVAREDMGG
jgi:Protein of unknown function (DUF1488)